MTFFSNLTEIHDQFTAMMRERDRLAEELSVTRKALDRARADKNACRTLLEKVLMDRDVDPYGPGAGPYEDVVTMNDADGKGMVEAMQAAVYWLK